MLSMSKLARVGALALMGVLAAGCATPKPTSAPSPAPTAAPSARPVITPSPGPTAVASGATTTVSVEARDLSFTPKALEVPADEPFELTMHNAGRIVHNVTIDAPGVQLVVSPGRSGTTVIEGLAPGTYPFYCSVSGHRQAGMEGTLTVR
jgi:uncharacterized cupredoxin-like copper-binding protein